MPRYTTDLTIRTNEDRIRHYGTVIPSDPLPEEVEYKYTARAGDRWDTIAYKYLGSAKLWYVVANANDALNGSIFIKPGTVITIPENY